MYGKSLTVVVDRYGINGSPNYSMTFYGVVDGHARVHNLDTGRGKDMEMGRQFAQAYGYWG